MKKIIFKLIKIIKEMRITKCAKIKKVRGGSSQ